MNRGGGACPASVDAAGVRHVAAVNVHVEAGRGEGGSLSACDSDSRLGGGICQGSQSCQGLQTCIPGVTYISWVAVIFCKDPRDWWPDRGPPASLRAHYPIEGSEMASSIRGNGHM